MRAVWPNHALRFHVVAWGRTTARPTHPRLGECRWAGHELDRVARPKVRRGEISIYNREEITKLLAASATEFVPVLAVAASAGVRAAEIERLAWAPIGHVGSSPTSHDGRSRTQCWVWNIL